MTVFHLTSSQLRVTDPCYTKGTWCAGVLDNVLPGKWIAEKVVASHAQTGWGDRIAELDTFYGKVCAGTAGEYRTWQEPLYNEEMIQEMEKLYSKKFPTENGQFDEEKVRALIESLRTAMRTRSEPDYLGIANVGFGVATHSGYGDGGYQCFVGRNENGEIVAARIEFIGDENDEDEDDDENAPEM